MEKVALERYFIFRISMFYLLFNMPGLVNEFYEQFISELEQYNDKDDGEENDITEKDSMEMIALKERYF
jgi:hypothetical protein